jgi:hypothetical protein
VIECGRFGEGIEIREREVSCGRHGYIVSIPAHVEETRTGGRIATGGGEEACVALTDARKGQMWG